jgi:hypothetical protein
MGKIWYVQLIQMQNVWGQVTCKCTKHPNMPMCEEQRKEISKGARDCDYHRNYNYGGIFGVC